MRENKKQYYDSLNVNRITDNKNFSNEIVGNSVI